MHIALTFPSCHRRGGVERIMVECARFLHHRGHTCTVLASEFDEGVLPPAVSQHHIPTWPASSVPKMMSFARNATRALAELSPPADIHASFGVNCPWDGVLWVQSVHAKWLDVGRKPTLAGRLMQQFNPFHPYILHREQRYFAERRYRKLIALTPEVKDDLMTYYRVPSRDIVILPNGFSPGEFNLDCRSLHRDRMRQKLGYSPDDRVVAFVANELDRKGFGPLLHAVAALRDSSIRILVVGRVSPGAYKPLISRLGLTDRIHFAGSSDQVAHYYAAADLFVLPTVYEAWGLVIVEAMACGLPVLTSRLAGAACVVQEGRTGSLLADPRDPQEISHKLDLLLRGNHDPRDSIAYSVQHLRWDNILQTYDRILRECVMENSSAHSLTSVA